MSTKLFFHNAFVKRGHFSLVEGSRPWNAIIFISDGSFRFTMNGKEFTVNENEVAFFPQDVFFTREVISPMTFHQFGFHSSNDENQIFMPSPDCGKLNVPHSYIAAVARMLDGVDKNVPQGRKRIYHNCLDGILMAHYIRSCVQDSGIGADKDVAAVVEYMYDHIDEKINIAELAQQRHLTHTGLIGKFKRVYGCTPNEYLIKLRINLAKRLISEGQLRINEIALQCGYSNAYYFSNAFHKYLGVSPSTYRDGIENAEK